MAKIKGSVDGEKRMKWWREARFGMFIHWGVYSVLERGEWVMYMERIPKAEYAQLAQRFNPRKYNADEWVALAQEAGMKYMVLTSRHHDGFCLWNTATTDYSAPRTAAKRDLVGEYMDACHRAGMKVGLYYSLLDWRWPAYWLGPEKAPEAWAEYVAYVHAQVEELVTKYGRLDILWYDGAWPWNAEQWQSEKLNAVVRKHQPHILINNRSGLPEDFGTPEQHIAAEQRPWEACMTIDELWWGWHPGDPNVKSGMTLVRKLVECVSQGGNFLLNVGPKADGTIPAVQAARLREVGRWLAANGESVYGCGAPPCGGLTFRHFGWITARKNTLYLHVCYWCGEEVVLGGLQNKVKKATLLATGQELAVRQVKDRTFISGLPRKAPDPIDTVIALEVAGTPKGISPNESTFWQE
jgi:alpha-L-fucosidase